MNYSSGSKIYMTMDMRSLPDTQTVVFHLPSPCAASFQALSVNAFRWRIRDERPGDA